MVRKRKGLKSFAFKTPSGCESDPLRQLELFVFTIWMACGVLGVPYALIFAFASALYVVANDSPERRRGWGVHPDAPGWRSASNC